MTFLELILLIEERGEKAVIGDRPFNLTTDKYSYSRIDGEWIQRELPIPIIAESPFLPLTELPPKEIK